MTYLLKIDELSRLAPTLGVLQPILLSLGSDVGTVQASQETDATVTVPVRLSALPKQDTRRSHWLRNAPNHCPKESRENKTRKWNTNKRGSTSERNDRNEKKKIGSWNLFSTSFNLFNNGSNFTTTIQTSQQPFPAPRTSRVGSIYLIVIKQA